MCVAKKLLKIQQETRALGKDASGSNYQFVSGSKLLGVIRPKMDELGLILTQEIIGIENTPVTYNTSKGTKTEMFTSIHLQFTWVDCETGDKLVNDFFANGMNSWDKGLGSALTYAERYYLMKTFHIATDEDDVDALIREEDLPELEKDTEDWNLALEYVGKGHDPEGLRSKRSISDELMAELKKRFELINDLNNA